MLTRDIVAKCEIYVDVRRDKSFYALSSPGKYRLPPPRLVNSFVVRVTPFFPSLVGACEDLRAPRVIVESFQFLPINAMSSLLWLR